MVIVKLVKNMDLIIPMALISGFFLLYFTLFLGYNRV